MSERALITRPLIDRAAARVAGHVRVTPLVDLDGVTLKLEYLQHAGSFKSRGMYNGLLAADVPPAGVVIASGGNAGAAMARAARTLGIAATVFVPTTSAAAKIQRLRGYGATVIQIGAEYSEALTASSKHAVETGALVVHAYDQSDVVAGQGTLARELDEQLARDGHAPPDTVLVAVGGGGLIAGIAAWYAGTSTRVIGVETIGCPTLRAALDAGHPIDVATSGIAADALGARRIGEICWQGREAIADVVLVSDDAVVATQQRLWNELRVMSEPAGATAYTAINTGVYETEPGERVVAIVCGANTDPSSFVSSETRLPAERSS